MVVGVRKWRERRGESREFGGGRWWWWRCEGSGRRSSQQLPCSLCFSVQLERKGGWMGAVGQVRSKVAMIRRQRGLSLV